MQTALLRHYLHGIVQHRPGKPRKAGLTHGVDRLDIPAGAVLPHIFDYVDVVKVGWGLPALLSPDEMFRRVAWYRKHDVAVSSGGTLTEYALLKDHHDDYLKGLAAARFDIVELSEGRLRLSPSRRRRFGAKAANLGLKLAVKVGSKNPREQLAVAQLDDKLAQAIELDPALIIVEAGEGLGVTLYDGQGEVRWDVLDQVETQATGRTVLYEAPLRRQRGALIGALGPDANIGGVPLAEVPELETQRLGIMSGETFGIPLKPRRVEGGPAVKFVHHLVSAGGPIGQAALVRQSGLPRRTVQAALERLRRDGLVTEERDTADMRRRIYRTVG